MLRRLGSREGRVQESVPNLEGKQATGVIVAGDDAYICREAQTGFCLQKKKGKAREDNYKVVLADELRGSQVVVPCR